MIRFVFSEQDKFKESYWVRNDYSALQAEIENGDFEFFENVVAFKGIKYINQILLELQRNPFYYAKYEPPKGQSGSMEDFIVRLKDIIALCKKYPNAQVKIIQGQIK